MTRDEFTAARRSLGMTQAQLAEAMGCARRTIQEIEGAGQFRRVYALAMRQLVQEAVDTQPQHRQHARAETVERLK